MHTGMRRLALLFLTTSISSSMSISRAAGKQDDDPLPAEAALRVQKIADILPLAVSPDGRRLAYTTQHKQRAESVDQQAYIRTGVPPWAVGTDIVIQELGNDEAKNLTEGRGDNWLPAWSPDGRYLAFLSDRGGSGQAQLWVWDAVNNGLRKVSDVNVRANEIAWTRDSRRVLVTTVPQSVKAEGSPRKVPSPAERIGTSKGQASSPTVVLYESSDRSHGAKAEVKSDPWDLDLDLLDLTFIDIHSGEVVTIVRGKRISTFYLSPDGCYIAYAIPRRFEKPGSQQILFNLAIISLSTNQDRIIGSDIPLGFEGAEFSWSPDSLRIAYRESGPGIAGDCYVIGIKDGNSRNVSKFTSVEYASRYRAAAPLWDRNGNEIYFIRKRSIWRASVDKSKVEELGSINDHQVTQLISLSGRQLWTPDARDAAIVVAHDDSGEEDGIYRIDLANGQNAQLLERGECYTCANSSQHFTVTSDGQRVIYVAENAQEDEDLWISDEMFQTPRRLTHLNPQFDKYKMGSARLIRWFGDDGEELQGALLLPSDYRRGQRYPLIVWVYGGSLLSKDVDQFGLAGPGPFNMQLLATRGYAVLLPDAPQHLGTPLLDLAKTVLPGVNKVVEMGIADPDRIGVMGHSYGGYSTLGLIVQTNRFKAAVEMDGYADMVAEYGAMNRNGAAFGTSVDEQGQGLMGGTPWQFRERYIQNSPIFFLDRIETPLLIIHGGDDTTVPAFLGDEVFVGLRRLGKEAEYTKYEGEGHSPLYWNYANQLDLSQRILDWFEVHLKSTGDQKGLQ